MILKNNNIFGGLNKFLICVKLFLYTVIRDYNVAVGSM